jgi:hypothetical protein
MRFDIVAEANSGLLCRLIGLFAQHGDVVPDLRVQVIGKTMRVLIELEAAGELRCANMAEKMRQFIGVIDVALDAVPVNA